MAITEAITPATKNTASGTSDTLAYGSAVSAGALLLAGFRVGDVDGAKTLTVSDSVNGAWTKADGNYRAASATTDLWYFANSGAGTPTVSISFGGTATTIRWSIHAYAGAATSSVVDQTNDANGSAAATSGHDITTTVADALLFAIVQTEQVSTLTAAAGYTLRAQVLAAPNTRYGAQHQIVSATGTYTGAFTLNGAMVWSAVHANFKASTAAAPSIMGIYNRQIG